MTLVNGEGSPMLAAVPRTTGSGTRKLQIQTGGQGYPPQRKVQRGPARMFGIFSETWPAR